MCEPQSNQIQPDSRAMEEWKQLQTIIGRLEILEFQVRGWLLVLLGALVAALFNGDKLKPSVFAWVSVLVLFAFSGMELVFRKTKRTAIQRVVIVEKHLRTNMDYDGPRISDALGKSTGWREGLRYLWKEAKLVRVWSFYTALLLIVISVAIFSSRGGSPR